MCLEHFSYVTTKFLVLFLPLKSKNQIPCLLCAVATLILSTLKIISKAIDGSFVKHKTSLNSVGTHANFSSYSTTNFNLWLVKKFCVPKGSVHQQNHSVEGKPPALTLTVHWGGRGKGGPVLHDLILSWTGGRGGCYLKITWVRGGGWSTVTCFFGTASLLPVNRMR